MDEEDIRQQNALRLSWITFILLIGISFYTAYTITITPTPAIIGLLITVTLTVLAAISIQLAKRGHHRAGIVLFLSAILILLIPVPLLASGMGLLLFVVAFTITAGISTATLPAKYVGRLILVSLLTGSLTVLVDQYAPSGRPMIPFPLITEFILVGITFLYGIIMLRNFTRYDLRTKLILAFLSVTLLPLSIVALITDHEVRTYLMQETERNLLYTASQAASNIDGFILNRLDMVRAEAQIPGLTDLLVLPDELVPLSPQITEVNRTLLAFSRKDPVYITSYALLNSQGVNIADTDGRYVGLREGQFDYFIQAIESNLPYVSSVHFPASPKDPPVIFFSSPVRDGSGNIIGVLRVCYNANILQNILNTVRQENAKGAYATLIDYQYYLRLADTNNQKLSYTTMLSLPASEVVEAQEKNRLPPGLQEEWTMDDPQVVEILAQTDTDSVLTLPSLTLDGEPAISAVAHIRNSPWLVLAQQSQAQALLPVERQTRATAMAALVIAMLVMVMATGIAQLLVRPIIDLTEASQKITAGDLDARAPVETHDEIGLLANAFNTMSDELQSTLASLEQRVAQRTAELESKNRELETFAYSVSHDLKAPLRGIDGYSRLLKEDYQQALDEDGRTFLDNIRRAAAQMNQLIDDLLAYSRLQRRTITTGQVDLNQALQNILLERSGEIQRRQVHLVVDVPCQLVNAETEGLSQVLRNLIDNALKFTANAAPPRIEIGGREDGDAYCLLWVKDNGIGFDMKYHDRIFEIFQRLHRVEDFPGTGIGLALVRMAMQRMGGDIWAESAPGEGATFYLRIPRS